MSNRSTLFHSHSAVSRLAQKTLDRGVERTALPALVEVVGAERDAEHGREHKHAEKERAGFAARARRAGAVARRLCGAREQRC